MTPSEALGAACAATLAALIRVHARDGRATVRSVAAERGVAFSSVQHQLVTLRNLGAVTWEDGKDGTLRPLVRPERVFGGSDYAGNELDPATLATSRVPPKPSSVEDLR